MIPVTKLAGLSGAQERAIVAASEALPGTEIILVGALGLGHHIEMGYRSTDDVDLIVGVELDEFPGPLPAIAGWRQGGHEHRFHSDEDVQIDILPAGPALRGAGAVRWKDEFTMSLVGFDLAFAHRDQVRLSPSACVAVPHAQVFMVLKIVSWLDRPAERMKDLQDIAHLLENYLADDDMRHWSDEIVAANVNHDLHSAYVLGRDLGAIIEGTHRDCIDRFLRKPPLTWLIERGPQSWASSDDRAEQVLAIFERGLTETRTL